MKKYELSKETTSLLRKRKKGCFACKIISDDVKKNGRLTTYPVDGSGKSAFPIKGKVAHIEVEKEIESKRGKK